ncbi:MAG: TlpA family protein disulfide reductase [Ignavibacteria bacterium]|nr:TlpA family protein disulfide reductase [Ignavibacteria bacterium]
MKVTARVIFLLVIMNLILSAQINIKSKTIDGEDIQLMELVKNGPVLINFWATWCQPCKAEMKHLKALYDKYSEKGLTIIGFNLDSPKSVAKVKSFVSSQELKYPIVLDTNSEIFNKFSGQVMPYSILFNTDGNIVFKHTGYLPGDEDRLENEILKLLN